MSRLGKVQVRKLRHRYGYAAFEPILEPISRAEILGYESNERGPKLFHSGWRSKRRGVGGIAYFG